MISLVVGTGTPPGKPTVRESTIHPNENIEVSLVVILAIGEQQYLADVAAPRHRESTVQEWLRTMADVTTQASRLTRHLMLLALPMIVFVVGAVWLCLHLAPEVVSAEGVLSVR